MNIYVRYFDQEALASSYEELMEFLTSIPEIPVTPELMDSVRAYMDSPLPYPKRYKVRPRVYFILIKTTAQTMQEFKTYKSQELNIDDEAEVETITNSDEDKLETSNWYEAKLTFKRVIVLPETEKCQYVDTDFAAYIKASSESECYTKIKDYLTNHPDVDVRSQIPSAKSNYFVCKQIGEILEDVESVQESSQKVNAGEFQQSGADESSCVM
jgi:hypothetical protein